jgi:hypothetical protein
MITLDYPTGRLGVGGSNPLAPTITWPEHLKQKPSPGVTGGRDRNIGAGDLYRFK